MATATQINAFIKKLGALAVAESNRRIASGKGFVLPSVCIAQSALETGWGTSGLMTRANAYFGIKAGGSWKGSVYTADTWEVANGESYNTTANFRAYASLADSVKDYYDLIGNNTRYSNALSFGTNSSAWKSPKACITAIWAGGYATDTLYVEKIMSTINARGLADFDKKIDGVSTNVTTSPEYLFTAEDFKQGSLEVIDSGRSVGLDSSQDWAVSLDWDKAPTAEVSANYKVTIPAKFFPSDIAQIVIRKLAGDTVTSSSVIAEADKGVDPEFTITVNAGEKFGFTFWYTYENAISYIKDKTATLSIIDTNSTFSDISTAERFNEPIAHFVKI